MFLNLMAVQRALPTNYRPSLIDEGKPCSQPRGLFHGRADMLSGSVVLQPVAIPASTTSRA
jgi:hypothetical protein